MKLRTTTILSLLLVLLSGLLAGNENSSEAKHIRVYGVYNPTIKRYDNLAIFATGISYQPERQVFSLGVDLMYTMWHSKGLYSIERSWRLSAQSRFQQGDMLVHQLYGLAANIGFRVGEGSRYWSGSTIQVGLYGAFVMNPHYFLVIEQREGKRKPLLSPYVRLTRPITYNLPLIVVGQVHYIPSVGIITQFMLGLNLGFL